MSDIPLALPYEVTIGNLLRKETSIHSIQATQRHIVNSIRLDLAEQSFLSLEKDLVSDLKASLLECEELRKSTSKK